MRSRAWCAVRACSVHSDPSPVRHRLEHRDDLAAPDLADDDPAQVHPQRVDDQVRRA